jgi:tRNA A-37 threonylcarbamoyl transferase component Bud32
VWRARLLGRDVAVKRWELRGLARWKALVHAWRGDRHWRGAAWLMKHDIPTARPLVLAMDQESQYLVMEWIAGRSILECLDRRDLPARREHAMARSVGDLTMQLYRAGRFNRDHKPSNLIATGTSEREAIAIIDCVGLRRFWLDDDDKLERMLASLYVEPLGCGCPPRRTLVLRAIRATGIRYSDGPSDAAANRRFSIRRAWDTAARIVRWHGDSRPRINPLATSQPDPAVQHE